jgi:hypothetical protein
MSDRTPKESKLFNASPALADAYNEVMHKYQLLGRDIETLRDHLAAFDERGDVGIRVMACMLTCATLQEKLCQAQIIAYQGK